MIWIKRRSICVKNRDVLRGGRLAWLFQCHMGRVSQWELRRELFREPVSVMRDHPVPLFLPRICTYVLHSHKHMSGFILGRPSDNLGNGIDTRNTFESKNIAFLCQRVSLHARHYRCNCLRDARVEHIHIYTHIHIFIYIFHIFY